jgi:hypothetical protein
MPETEILLHLRLFIPKYNPIPFEKIVEYAEQTYLRACHRRKGGGTQKDYEEKMFKPVIDGLKRLLSDDFVSKRGLTKEQIIKKTEEGKKEAGRAYLENLNQAFETVDGIPAQAILEKLPLNSAKYGREMTFGEWRLIGPIDGRGTGAAILAGRYLSGLPVPKIGTQTGDLTTLQFLRGKDQLITGEPVLITEPKRAGQLRKQLQNQLLRSGELIAEAHYSDEEIRKANKRTNELVQEFTLDKFEPFSPGGDSHIDLVVDPQSVTPADSKEVLEIKYKINEFFLGEKMAKDIRRTSIEKDYSLGPYPRDKPTRPDPDEYLGKPGKKAYFDMYLDIRVEKR